MGWGLTGAIGLLNIMGTTETGECLSMLKLNVGSRTERYTHRRGVRCRHLQLRSGGYHPSPCLSSRFRGYIDGAFKSSEPRSRQSPAVCVLF